MLVKARRGFGSRHIFRAESAVELEFFLARTPVDSMVQAVCHGAEFSIDVFCDLDGRCLNAIPRTMIESKGGESIKGMTVRDWDLIEHGRAVAEALPLKGPGTIQCFREADGTHRVTDVNARFGGAFPLPHAAGSGYPELALALARGERPEPRLGEFREGIVMTRFFSHLTLVSARRRFARALLGGAARADRGGVMRPVLPPAPRAAALRGRARRLRRRRARRRSRPTDQAATRRPHEPDTGPCRS